MNTISTRKAKNILSCIGMLLFAVLYLQMRPATEREKLCTKKMSRHLVLDSLFEGENTEFASAGKCDHCHGYDENGMASTDGEGGDVNVVDDWSSTMMANSAKDPFWPYP